MEYLVTFLEGVITFISPCLLPMLPIYIAYFAGGGGYDAAPQNRTQTQIASMEAIGSASDGSGSTVNRTQTENAAAEAASSATDGSSATENRTQTQKSASSGDTLRSDTRHTRRTLINALGFVCGFTLVFTLLGAFAGSLGALLVRHQRVIDIVCGAIIVALGLNYLGVFRIPALERTLRPNAQVRPRTFATSFIFGMVFAIGWTPCVGTFLASALSLAASVGTTAKGVLLLLCYSAGLGLPFVLSALALDQLSEIFVWVRLHREQVDRVSGALLIVLGLLMATGLLGRLLRLLV